MLFIKNQPHKLQFLFVRHQTNLEVLSKDKKTCEAILRKKNKNCTNRKYINTYKLNQEGVSSTQDLIRDAKKGVKKEKRKLFTHTYTRVWQESQPFETVLPLASLYPYGRILSDTTGGC